VSLRVIRADGGTELAFAGHLSEQRPATRIFPTLQAAAGFLSLGATGYSATYSNDHYHGMELRSLYWTVAPLAIDEAHSCFFDDRQQFPSGTAELDCALLMRDIQHEWHSRPDLYVAPTRSFLSTRHAKPTTNAG
jgi:hypothetical protein